MMKFLRKYQRAVFGVITVLVIVSFAFFGTYGALQGVTEKPDRIVGKGIDGSPIHEREIANLAHFFDTEGLDQIEGRNGGNLFSDGVIRSEILKSGIGALLFEKYEEELKGEFRKKLAQFQKFRPYVHPDKMIGMELTWKRFFPTFYDDFVKFKAMSGENGKETFEALVTLYLDQLNFPPELMRQMLIYQQQQYRGMISQDPYLQGGDLSLFHAKSLTDWFGPKYIELLAQFIHNAALYAEMKGYTVSLEEAKASLLQTGMENMRGQERSQKSSLEDVQQIFSQQLRSLGMKEKDAVKAWQRVLLFRRMFNDVGYGVFVDSLLYKRFHEYASKSAKLEIYTVPEELQFKTAEDVMKFEIYLDATMDGREGLDLSERTKEISEIMAKAPELVQRRFVLEVASSTRDEISADIGLRETWNWEVEDQNWKVLCEQFNELKESGFIEGASRKEVLESLDKEVRRKVDLFAREAIFEENPGMIRERLSSVESAPKNIAIALKGDREPLPGIKDRAKLLALLESTPVKNEGGGGNMESSEKLTCYTEDGKNFFRIDVVERSSDYEVMSYKDAVKYHVLDDLLENRLRREYEEKGSLEDFEEEREALGKRVFSYVAKGVAKGEKAYDGLSGVDPWEVAVKRRLAVFLRRLEERAKLGKIEEAPEFKQWALKKEEIVVSRKNPHELFREELFDLPEGSWSGVLFESEKGPLFYQILDRYVEDTAIKSGLEEGRALLGNEARTCLMKSLIDEFSEKKVIVLELKEVE